MIEIDLMRALFAFFCGYFLTLSGSLTQTVANNSLASPSTLGFDALAALCVILAQGSIVLLKIPAPLEYLSFAVFAAFFLFIAAMFSRNNFSSARVFSLDVKYLILLGLAFNLFVGAVFAVIQFMFMALNYDFPSGLWFGNFRFYHEGSLILFSLFFIAVQFGIAKFGSSLRLLSLGEDMALGLGVDVKKTQKVCLLASLFMTGLVISFFGVFSFLSLIIPHMLRSFSVFKRNMKNELMLGAPLGGAVLAVLDYLCFRFDYLGAELPAGMVSSVAGAFLLIVLLWKSQVGKSQAKSFGQD